MLTKQMRKHSGWPKCPGVLLRWENMYSVITMYNPYLLNMNVLNAFSKRHRCPTLPIMSDVVPLAKSALFKETIWHYVLFCGDAYYHSSLYIAVTETLMHIDLKSFRCPRDKSRHLLPIGCQYTSMNMNFCSFPKSCFHSLVFINSQKENWADPSIWTQFIAHSVLVNKRDGWGNTVYYFWFRYVFTVSWVTCVSARCARTTDMSPTVGLHTAT